MIVNVTKKIKTECFIDREDSETVRAYMQKHNCNAETAIKVLQDAHAIDIFWNSDDYSWELESVDEVNIDADDEEENENEEDEEEYYYHYHDEEEED